MNILKSIFSKFINRFITSSTTAMDGSKLFPHLPPWEPIGMHMDAEELHRFIADQYTDVIQRRGYADHLFMVRDDTEVTEKLPAGYTYFGQLIAHELTFLQNRLRYHRPGVSIPIPARLQLETIYDGGPDHSPIHFDQSKFFGRTHFQLAPPPKSETEFPAGEFRQLLDLNRQVYLTDHSCAVALIPDARNDENIVLSQLHLAFQAAHNRLVQQLIDQSEALGSFAEEPNCVKQKALGSNTLVKHNLPSPKIGHPNLKQLLTEQEHRKNNILKNLKQKKEQFFAVGFSPPFTEVLIADKKETLEIGRLTQEIKENVRQLQDETIEDLLYGYFSRARPAILDNLDQIETILLKKNKEIYDIAATDITAIREIAFLAEMRSFEQDAQNAKNSLEFNANKINATAIDLLDEKFETTKRILSWHLQWLVLNDFLPRLVDRAILEKFYRNTREKGLIISDEKIIWKNRSELPLEFSVAFFRFGHSMIRKVYDFNKKFRGGTIFQPKKLNQALDPGKWLNWRLFFSAAGEDAEVQNKAARIDPFISSQMLANLGILITGDLQNIVLRNLMRSFAHGLPAGQEIANDLVKKKIVKKDQLESHPSRKGKKDELINELVTKIPLPGLSETDKKAITTSLCDHSPLWFYTLMEAHLCEDGLRLGPVAGTIITEILVGIIKEDPNSFYRQNCRWQPHLRENGDTPDPDNHTGLQSYTVVDLLKFAKVYPPERKA